MSPERGVGRAGAASQSFSEGSGCVEAGNLPLRDKRRAQIGSVDLVSVGGVYERDAMFAKLKGAVGQGAAVALGLADDLLCVNGRLLCLDVRNGLSVKEEQVVAR